MGNPNTGWGTFTWDGEHSHRAGIPKNLVGNNYTCILAGNIHIGQGFPKIWQGTTIHATGAGTSCVNSCSSTCNPSNINFLASAKAFL